MSGFAVPPLSFTQKWSLCVYVAVLFCLSKASFFFTFYYLRFVIKDSELDFVELACFLLASLPVGCTNQHKIFFPDNSQIQRHYILVC